MDERSEQNLNKEEFDDIFKLYKDRMIVQYTSLSYGSMIYFTMNDTLLERDNMFELTLWGWHWKIFNNDEEFCNSITITREFAETALSKAMRGHYFESVKLEENKCILGFSNGFKAILEQRSQEEDGQDLFFLSIPDNNDSLLILTNETPPQFKFSRNGDRPAIA